MYYCIIYYPNIDTSKIQKLRQKYDPTYKYIDTHLTLVFPINTDSVNFNDLNKHIQNVVKKYHAFEIRLNGLEKSWDHWLFLGVDRGRNKLLDLYDKLYLGVLKPHLRKDIPFSPHISLGLFVQEGSGYNLKNPKAVAFNKNAYEHALKEAELAGLIYTTRVDRLTLVKMNDNLSRVLESKDFVLLR